MNAATTSVSWFARHESRLIWRDFIGMMTGGKPQRIVMLGVILSVIILGLHYFAASVIGLAIADGVVADKATLLAISGGLLMFFSLMFSQAIESVTRAYYARADLDLILSSPAPSNKLFAVRTMVLGVQTVALSTLIASPLINVMIALDGPHWIAAYVVLFSLGCLATSAAVWLTLTLFRLVGPARTRLIAQIVAAIVGAGFVIALQAVAIVFGQGITRFALFTASDTVKAAADPSHWQWLPAKAVMGASFPLAIVLLIGLAITAATVVFSSRRFERDVLATAGMVEKKKKVKAFTGFASRSSLRGTLRRKEWQLLKRDPWLVSQSLQQIFYLIPPALMLWFNLDDDFGIFYVIVPVVAMAAGQLAGGLAWLAISGEDAHELIETSPIPARTVLLAKIEAVMAIIAVVLAPFAVVLALFSIKVALWMIVGSGLAAATAVTVQVMFRSQATRSLFRRRQVSSRAATLCEALVSIFSAAFAGFALAGSPMAIVPALCLAMVLGVAWLIKPERA